MRANLKKKRISLEMTQEQVANEAEITREHYTKIELGVSNPSIGVFMKLKKILGATDSDFEITEVSNTENKTA